MEKNFVDYITNPVFVIIILLIISFATIMPVINMILLGAILAYGLRPVSLKIKSKVKNSSLSIFLGILIFIVPVILLFVYIFMVLFGMSMDFISSNSANNFNLNYIIETIANYLPINQTQLFDGISSSLNGAITDALYWIANYTLKLAQKIPYISLELFILIASIFYFTRDGGKCYDFIKSIIPSKNMSFFATLTKQIESVLLSIFYGHFLTALIIGIIAAIGYFILGYPFALFLGIITGIFQLIPIMGPWPIYWILAIIDFINGNYVRAVIVILFGFGLSLSDMYIRPALSSHHADIHPLILLVGFLAGPFVFGIIGLIIGPLVLGITYAVIKSYQIEKNKGDLNGEN
ncbi:AI-2E family transporter [Methanobrevibacter sp. DSM 116169]|uniref:AI-2E family transporter n=1 Tax=Methanobrevibacter sp. DSM 116169 TaxID=3242727 RepID=UPI0038FC5BF9